MSENIALKAATAARVRVSGWRKTVAGRVEAADDGQTSVEYLGIIAVVVAIVLVIIGNSNLGTLIYQAIVHQISKVTG